MKHLILGHENDLHARTMLDALTARGHQAHLVASHKFPCELQMSVEPGAAGGSLTLADGQLIGFDEIGSVYWRNFCGVTGETTKATRGSVEDIAYFDSMACLRSWFQLENQTRWMNSWTAFQSHQEKPQQLQLVASAGVTIPRTYVGNNAQHVLAFCKAEPHAIFKPVYGGAQTERITDKHLDPAHLAKALTRAPITLQQYVAGTNIRTYAIGEQVFSAEMQTEDVDFRTDQDMLIQPIETPPEIARQCATIMGLLALRWTAIDWRRDVDGRYHFLEANPSPMFIGFERKTGYPIMDTLIAAMVS
ncbi:MAG: hypothetical protein V4582_11435 [Pseudomonadota bacterium]